MLGEPSQVIAKLTPLFDALGIRYVIGGSFASSLWFLEEMARARTEELDIGLLEVQGTALDHDYLDRWAPVLGVVSLLGRAREVLQGRR